MAVPVDAPFVPLGLPEPPLQVQVVQRRRPRVLAPYSHEQARFPVLQHPRQVNGELSLLVREKGKAEETEQIRYFFYITNEREWCCADVVHFAKDRCNQENLIAQLKSGVKALRLPVNTLEGNWAYMVIGALAWSIKVWLALLQPHKPHREALLRMEFKQFLQKWLTLPCQIVRGAGQMTYRILCYNEWVPVL